MAFELHNPSKRAITCNFHQPVGSILIPGGTFVPTPEQEDNGLTSEDFKDFVPSFLKPTPPAVRRRLLEGSNLEVPQNILNATSHLDEFGGMVKPRDAENLEKVVPSRPHRTEGTEVQQRIAHVDEELPETEKKPPESGEPEDTQEDSPVDEDGREITLTSRAPFVPKIDIGGNISAGSQQEQLQDIAATKCSSMNKRTQRKGK